MPTQKQKLSDAFQVLLDSVNPDEITDTELMYGGTIARITEVFEVTNDVGGKAGNITTHDGYYIAVASHPSMGEVKAKAFDDLQCAANWILRRSL